MFHINKIIALLYVVLVASLLTSCSPRKPDRIEESGSLEMVNIYLYRNDTHRVQPEFRNGDTIQDVYYMYVTDTSNEQYMKEFEGSLKKDTDTFDASEKERLLNLVGLEGWKRIPASGLFNS